MTTPLRAGSFLPPRPFEPNLTLDPTAGIGCLRPALQTAIIGALDALPDVTWTHDLNFRRAIVVDGRVWVDDTCLSDLDAFAWYCEVDRDPGSFDLDVLRTLARTTRVVRHPDAFRVAVDKFTAHLALGDAGVAVPECALFDHAVPERMFTLLERWGAAVLKPRLGGWGKGVTLVEHPGQLRDVVHYVQAVGGGRTFFFEQYLDNDLDRWLSVLMIGGEIAYGYRKRASRRHDFGGGRLKVLDPDERGGDVDLVDLTPAHEALAIAADAALDCGLIGFDMLWTDAGPVIVDENTSPGHYADLFAAVGRDPAAAWARWIASAIRG